MVFDAAAVATAVQMADQVAQQQAEAVVEPASEPQVVGDQTGTESISFELIGPADAGRTEIAFVDGSVANVQGIIASIDPSVEIVMLDSSRDGVEQIAAVLAGRSDIDAIHIVSHGSEGRLNLGNAVLNAASMQGRHLDELTAIGAALSADADVLIYGCDFTAGASGLEAAMILGGITGADIAASTDATGHANLGGDWDLESKFGTIDARSIDAPEWNGLLAPLNISTINPPTVTGTGAVGTTAVWTDAGTIGSTHIDVRATVTSLTTLGGLPFFGTLGDDPYFQLTQQGNATLRWEIFASGTIPPLSIAAFGSPEFRIADIDGIGGFIHTRKSVSPDLDHLSSYTVSAPTNLQVAATSGAIDASGTQDQNGESASLVGFIWNNVSSWEVTYTLHINDPFIQARFLHDGDGDFTFTAPVTTVLLGIDLDANNSTVAGTGYKGTFGGTPVPIVDIDSAITQHAALGTTIDSASIVLTNAQAGDELLVAGSLASSGTVNGLAYTVSSSGGQITIALSGSATPADYDTALRAITYNNALSLPNAVDRQITISVTNATYQTTSNEALSTIHVVDIAPVNTLAASYTVNEDTSVNLTGISVADVDAGTADVSVTLSVGTGALTLLTNVAGGVVGGAGCRQRIGRDRHHRADRRDQHDAGRDRRPRVPRRPRSQRRRHAHHDHQRPRQLRPGRAAERYRHAHDHRQRRQ